MKKQRITIVMIILSLLLLVGCGSSSDKENKAKSTNEKGTITFYVVRHGKTMLNTTERVQGWADAVLTPKGEKVVKAAGKGMKDIKFDSAYSSDSGRAIQTAEMILKENNKSTNVKLIKDSRFREFNFGSYEGDTNDNMWNDVAKDAGKTVEQWLKEGVSPKDFANSIAKLDKKRVEEGTNWPAEDYDTISTRLKKGIDDIVQKESKNGDSSVLLVSHGLSIGALIDTLSLGYILPNEGIKNASVTKIEYKDGKYTIKDINDLSYAKKGEKES